MSNAANIFKANELFATNTLSKNLPRTTFKRDNTNKFTFSAGKLIPIYVDEVLPGDTHKINYNYVIRMSTPIVPTMDTAVCDTYLFFVPNRIIDNTWEKLMGQNDDPWAQETEPLLGMIISTDDTKQGYDDDTLLSYYPDIPINKKILSKDDGPIKMPVNAYCQVWNDWFRDQNLQQCIFFDKSEHNIDIKNSIKVSEKDDTFIQNCQFGIELAPVSKLPDYFTTCLPAPQKHEPINIPIGTSAPIKNSTDTKNKFTPIWTKEDGSHFGDSVLVAGNKETWTKKISGGREAGAFLNLEADLSQASSITINALRQAEAIQELFEKDARGGTRYIEIIRSHFGVISPDSRMQRAEYIGGSRSYINIEQVLQTSAPSGDNPIGQLGAYSLTTGIVQDNIVYSSTEHGFIIGVACIRVLHTYAQGYGKMWKKRRRLDYYWPSLANIGETPIYKDEIFYNDIDKEENKKVFGYNEYGAEYRYKKNEVHGQFNPGSKQYNSAWTYTDNYKNSPTLNSDFIKESRDNIDQTLALIEADQFWIDLYFNNETTRSMPAHAIPGLGVN